MREGAECRSRILIQDAAAAHGKVQPLVRVERHRIGLGDSVEKAAARWGKGGESAVGRVNVEPQVVFTSEGRQFPNGVECARGGGSGIADDQKGKAAGPTILQHLASQILDIDFETAVSAHLA